MLKIRPHHLFCLLGFKGSGYSRAFVENMSRISTTIKKGLDLDIELVKGPDDICKVCPYLSGETCAKKT
ncbi:MAG: DUF1284 domain-containing protein [bacterium]|nr:DUF1284 domain-containing protein [bacterium]